MTLETWTQSLTNAAPPAGLSPALEALWRERHGDWTGAHTLCQEAGDADGAWVHAYLHRKEGDVSNAGYWYRRAGRPVQTGPLNSEWDDIAAALLAQDAGAAAGES